MLYICVVNPLNMPTLENIASPLDPKDYLESLSPYEMYELSCEIHEKDYFCECLIDVDTMSDDELRESLKKLSERLYLMTDKDKKLLTFFINEYI
jgi:hypothetical protein